MARSRHRSGVDALSSNILACPGGNGGPPAPEVWGLGLLERYGVSQSVLPIGSGPVFVALGDTPCHWVNLGVPDLVTSQSTSQSAGLTDSIKACRSGFGPLRTGVHSLATTDFTPGAGIFVSKLRGNVVCRFAIRCRCARTRTCSFVESYGPCERRSIGTLQWKFELHAARMFDERASTSDRCREIISR